MSNKDQIEFEKGKLLVARNCSYSLDDRKTQRNNNVLVDGGTGTGKTTRIVEPNLRQAVGSYLVSSPKTDLPLVYREYLEERGYVTLHFDFTKPNKSAHYNPLGRVITTQDILKIASVLVDEKKVSLADPFWDENAVIFIASIIGYMKETGYEPYSLNGILKLIREGERDSDSKDSALARRFKKLREKSPNSWACNQFDNVNQSPDKTYDCIRATLTTKFARFDTEELEEMMSCDDIVFEEIGQKKMAVFVTVSDTDRSMDVLVNVFLTQVMQCLCEYADNECEEHRLPVPVRLLLDDFATNCRILEFPRMVASIRSRSISVMIMIQSEAQLSKAYGDDDRTIIANCDTYVYLGGNDITSAREVSIRSDKPLQEILNMPVGDCWVFRRGELPVYSKTLERKDITNGKRRNDAKSQE